MSGISPQHERQEQQRRQDAAQQEQSRQATPEADKRKNAVEQLLKKAETAGYQLAQTKPANLLQSEALKTLSDPLLQDPKVSAAVMAEVKRGAHAWATAVEDAVKINNALHRVGFNDTDAIFQVLQGKSKAEIAYLQEAYKAKFGKDLKADVRNEYSWGFGRHTADREAILSYLSQDAAKAAAHRIQALSERVFVLDPKKQASDILQALDKEDLKAS